jgi:hypothetical protein
MANKKSRFLKLSVFLAVVVFFGGGVSQAEALTLSPIRIEVSADPGEKLTRQMTLINETDKTVTYYSSYANFEAQGESGNPAFVDAKDDLGTWITTESAITLSPKESRTVVFTIKVPTDATPGGHFASLFWGTIPPSSGGSEVSIGAKTGLLLLLSVNGEVKVEGGLSQFNTKNSKFWYNTLPVDFEYRFRNDGGDRIKPSGKLVIRDTVYIPAARLDGNPVEGNILPNSTRKFDLSWVKHPREKEYIASENPFMRFRDTVTYQWKNFAFGFYTAQLSLTYGSISGVKSVHFFVFPWQLLIVLVVILIVVLWGGEGAMKRYNRYIIEKARIGTPTSL